MMTGGWSQLSHKTFCFPSRHSLKNSCWFLLLWPILCNEEPKHESKMCRMPSSSIYSLSQRIWSGIWFSPLLMQFSKQLRLTCAEGTKMIKAFSTCQNMQSQCCDQWIMQCKESSDTKMKTWSITTVQYSRTMNMYSICTCEISDVMASISDWHRESMCFYNV